MPSSEQVVLAQKYMLPKSFFLYENKAPCRGCLGCYDDIEGTVYKGWYTFYTSESKICKKHGKNWILLSPVFIFTLQINHLLQKEKVNLRKKLKAMKQKEQKMILVQMHQYLVGKHQANSLSLPLLPNHLRVLLPLEVKQVRCF